jgi:hypothetical protein
MRPETQALTVPMRTMTRHAVATRARAGTTVARTANATVDEKPMTSQMGDSLLHTESLRAGGLCEPNGVALSAEEAIGEA